MNPAEIDDLKQFITTTVTNIVDERITERVPVIVKTIVKTEVQASERRLKIYIDNVQTAIADTITGLNEENDRRFNNHERRLVKLEHGVAS